MTPSDFCYWLQGYVELGGSVPTEAQWTQVKDHLALVFTKVTPTRAPRPTVLPDNILCLDGSVAPDSRPTYCTSILPRREDALDESTPLQMWGSDHTC